MKIYRHTIPEIYDEVFCNTKGRSVITASISSREITRNMIRVKSSNIWSYTINVRSNNDKTGDVYVQFKDGKGGPGDVYVYYDVPIDVYRRWHSASSKGHFHWRYIRNKYKYSKLTGDKRTKLKNGVTSRPNTPNNRSEEPEEVEDAS